VTSASPQSGPEVLAVGFGEESRLSRRVKFLLAFVLLALLAGFLVWRVLPPSAPLFSLSDLQDVYAPYEATNNASVIDRLHTSEEVGYILPAACEPLFEATVLNRFPREAIDGVGTFWEIDHSAVSLFTYRFADVAKVDREYGRLAAALDNCQEVPVEVHARPATRGLLTVTPVLSDSDVTSQLGYVLTANDGIKLAVHVLAFSNTVSWQFRYEPVAGKYSPLVAQRVMDSLADQMHAVQDLHR
jgi:hypothetical protein